jgi:hypothetical protein
MAFPNVSDIIATTIEERSGELADNVTDNNAVLAWIKSRGGVRTFSGGRIIYEEIMYADNANTNSFSGYDQLPVAAADVITAAEYNIRQYATAVPMSGLEMLQNAGDAQSIDLMEGRIQVAEASLRNRICLDLYGDGTGNGGKNLTGLLLTAPVDPTTGTYAAINRATAGNEFWRSQLQDETVNASTIQTAMNSLYAKCSRGKDVPQLVIMGTTAWKYYLNSVQLLQRFADGSKSKLGFPTLQYMNADVVLDGGIGGNMTATDVLMLNLDYLSWRPHSKANFVPLGGPEARYAYNQDAKVVFIGFAGNLTCRGAQFQGRGTFD